jgi:hypothetical protein
MLHPSRVTPLLQPATVCGVVYFLSPQRVAGAFRTKNDMVHDAPLFGLMEAGGWGSSCPLLQYANLSSFSFGKNGAV